MFNVQCLKYLPLKSYNTFGLVFYHLIFGLLAGLAGSIAVVLATAVTVHCNPKENIASDSQTRKDIDTECRYKYTQEFNVYPPLYLIIVNFVLMLLVSLIYAYRVKHSVESYANPSSTTINGSYGTDDNSRLLSYISPAAADPLAYQNSSHYTVFKSYVTQLLVYRIIILAIFGALLSNSSNFPEKFLCLIDATNTSQKNFGENQMSDYPAVDCINLNGGNEEKLVLAVVGIYCFFVVGALMELSYLLVSACRDPTFCTNIEFCCVYLLNKRKTITKVIKKVKDNIKSDQIFCLRDDFGEPSLSNRKLEEIFVNVKIQEGRESTLACDWKLERRDEIFKAYLKGPVNSTFTKTADVFQRKEDEKEDPKTILVLGRPGIGKTFLTRKIFYDWHQEKSEFWHAKIVILIRFRAFNNKQTSLQQLLQDSMNFKLSKADLDGIYEYICLMPSNVILVFDGLDELKDSDDAYAIFKQLMNGEILHGVTVLTTSRPTAEHIYRDLQFIRKVEILGFTTNEIKDYVEKFCGSDTQTSSRIWHMIEKSPELLSLCYIPINSYIVCLTLMESLRSDEKEESNVTMTELYKKAVNVLLYRHDLKYKDLKHIPKDYIIKEKLHETLESHLDEAKQLAISQMEKGDKLRFKRQEVEIDLLDCGLFNNLEDKNEVNFCFVHLTIQEFLAARDVVDKMSNVDEFISSHIDDPNWHLVIQFVCGLVGEKKKKIMKQKKEKTSNDLTEPEIPMEKIFYWFQTRMPNECQVDCDEKILHRIKCVHEMQTLGNLELFASFARARELEDKKIETFCMTSLYITPMESTALFEYLSSIKTLRKLEFSYCVLEDSIFNDLATFLIKDNDITDIKLRGIKLTSEKAQHIIDAVADTKCKLTNLDIKMKASEDESVIKHLKNALKDSKCKLSISELIDNTMNP